ncbi:diaminopimelate decarboxylase, partial [Suttonella ornithocola]
IAFRINPDVDAQTHPYISTGMKDNKFGIALENAEKLYQTASELSGINIIGIGCHIGSQITTLDPFIKAFRSLKTLADKLSAQGINIRHIDIGGGLGIQMQAEQQVPGPAELVNALYQEMGGASYTLHLQPGRSIVGNSGLLLSRVIGIKKQSEKTFIMLDAAMNDYIRPALYQAVPQMRNLNQPNLTNHQADIVGPVCETGDTFAKNINLFAEEGDLIALAGVGAYGMSMSSQYNSRLRPAEIFIYQNKAKLIRKRDVFEQLWENEII